MTNHLLDGAHIALNKKYPTTTKAEREFYSHLVDKMLIVKAHYMKGGEVFNRP